MPQPTTTLGHHGPNHAPKALKGIRVLSLALNVPGPFALFRCKQMGASCVKLEPPGPAGAPDGTSGDPLALASASAYQQIHSGVRVIQADLKTEKGQRALHRELVKADVLITSFRPSALRKLGLNWPSLHAQYPALSMVKIVGAPKERAEEPGHDVTYLAENGLVTGLDLPATLYSDMGGALMTSEAVLQAQLMRSQKQAGVCLEVALSDAAAFLALPRSFGMTTRGSFLGGGHAGYRVYPCQDGRVAVAALEPHFAAALGREVGLKSSHVMAMFQPETHAAFATYFSTRTRGQLDQMSAERDIPLHTLA